METRVKNKCKAFTSLEQSRKLSEFLPLESADMAYDWVVIDKEYSKIPYCRKPIDDELPCWSIAALLEILPKKYYPIKDHKTDLILGKSKDKWCVLYWDTTGMQHGEETLANNPIDACYEMIIKLHEQNLL